MSIKKSRYKLIRINFEKEKMFLYYVLQVIHEQSMNRIICFIFNYRWPYINRQASLNNHIL